MATGTAWYNLTKPAPIENFNLSTWNTNLDMIDEQMHQNETETFTGATELANGTIGNVPAPLMADKDKFLKGDGTWGTPSGGSDMTGATSSTAGVHGLVPAPAAGDNSKFLKGDGTWDTPSGGGGSSSLSGLTDVDLSSPTNGQVLKYNSTTSKWENADDSGGSQRTYLGQLIPRVSAADSKITASTYSTSWGTFEPWKAFNGTPPSDLRNPDNCWEAQSDLENQWIQYHFDEARYFTQILVQCFSNYSDDWVGNVKVEGSNDGILWTNILASGTTYQLTAELGPVSEGGSGVETNVTIPLDDTYLWEYIRLTFVDKMFIAYYPTCFVDEIYVYGGEEISGGSSAEEMTLAEYNALTTEQKNDGTIRFIPNGSTISATTAIDMSSISSRIETSMNASSTSDQIVISWSGGNMIGCTLYYATPIDVTSWDKIRFDLTTSSCYGGGSSAQQARWNVQIGLQASAPSSVQVIDATDSRWAAVVDYANANTVYSNQELDVSELTGQYYLVINAHGWNAIIDDFVLEKIGVTYPSQIKYMDKTYGIGSGSDSNIVIVSRTDNTNEYAWLVPCDENGNTLKSSEVTLLSIFAEADMSGGPPYYNGLNVCVDTDGDRYCCKLYNTQTGGYAPDGTYSVDYTVAYIPKSGGSSGGGGNSWTDLTAVLEAGETSLTIIDSHITINGTYDFYTSKYGLNPLSVVIDDPFETRLLQPLVTQESELIVTATASTNWGGFEPWKAFANSAVNSGWIADGGSGGYWLQAEFPYKVNISSIDFKSLDSNRSHAISRVSYSNDGNTFTDATLTSSTMQNNIGHADVSMSETAKYIRLCFDYSLGTQTYPMVSQLELYGYIDSSSAGSMTLTFEEQTKNINVKVRVS